MFAEILHNAEPVRRTVKSFSVNIFSKNKVCKKIKSSERPATGSAGAHVVTLPYGLPGSAIALESADTC